MTFSLFPIRSRVRWLALCLLPLLLWAAWQSWTQSGLHSLAEGWRRAHAARDVAAMEALYHWEGVDEALRNRIRSVFIQEFELEVQDVKVRPLLSTDLVPGLERKINGQPVGVIEVRFAAEDDLSARLVAGRQGRYFRFLIVVPVAGP